MTYNINPIELIRLSEKLTQQEFAEKLGYNEQGTYAYHRNQFTADIIAKIQSVYDRDMNADIIAYLRAEVRKLTKELKAVTSLEKKHLSNDVDAWKD